VDGLPYTAVEQVDDTFEARLALRRENLDRFLAHHAQAVDRLAADRSAVDALADSHIWIASLPAQVLATHLEASRDLAHVLHQAEAYRTALSGPAEAARALVDQLPGTTRRVYGHGAVLALVIPESGVRIGITLAGEREELPGSRRRTDGLVAPAEERLEIPELTVAPQLFLQWVAGATGSEDMLRELPAWSSRNIGTALASTRRVLRNSAIPAPPPLRPL